MSNIKNWEVKPIRRILCEWVKHSCDGNCGGGDGEECPAFDKLDKLVSEEEAKELLNKLQGELNEQQIRRI